MDLLRVSGLYSANTVATDLSKWGKAFLLKEYPIQETKKNILLEHDWITKVSRALPPLLSFGSTALPEYNCISKVHCLFYFSKSNSICSYFTVV